MHDSNRLMDYAISITLRIVTAVKNLIDPTGFRIKAERHIKC